MLSASRRSKAACPGARRRDRRGSPPRRPPARARACGGTPRPDCGARPRSSRTGRSAAARSCPPPVRELHHALELSFLVVLGDEVAGHIGAEPALRADPEALDRNVLCRFLDFSQQLVQGFQSGDQLLQRIEEAAKYIPIE